MIIPYKTWEEGAHMPKEVRTVCFDPDLKVEAYRFYGIMQKFPNHFHDYYVIGYIDKGRRYMQCKNREHIINPGDIILLNPKDVHTCEQIDNTAMDYHSINIRPEVMQKTVQEITGREYLPHFSQEVLYNSDLVSSLRELHLMISEEAADFKKEELFLFLIEQLLAENSQEPAVKAPEKDGHFETVCKYLEDNFSQTITLDELCKMAGLSKYHFLRSFTRQNGISPYSYLEAVRIGKAKAFLEKGVPPMEVAYLTGFSDQSHFTNFFKKLIGLTPKQYMRIFVKEQGM
jgi:AraC-like DNA-binding protein/mannose-6-phosphate isomerase-like protein (cupin superfamily)